MDSELGRAVDSMAALVAFVTPTAEIEYFNREFLDYTGRTLEELQDWVPTDTVHPDDVKTILDAFQQLDRGLPYDETIRIRRFDGEYRRFRTRMAPCFDSDGAITRWCSVMADVEDQQRAEALLEGEVRMLEMVALGRPLSEVLSALSRLTEELVSGCVCSILLVEHARGGFHASGASLTDGRKDILDGAMIDASLDPCSLSVVLRAPVIALDIHTDRRWASSPWPSLMVERGLRSCRSTPILSDAGDVTGVFAIYRQEPESRASTRGGLIDRFAKIAGIAIQRARADEALRASGADLRRALWHVSEGQRLSKTGSFTADLQLDHPSWSEELFRIFEIDPKTEPTVRIVRDRVHPDDLALFDAEIERAVTEGASDFNFRMLMPSGGEKYLRVAARVIEGPILMGIVQDVTESTLAEQELRRSTASLIQGQHLAKSGSYVWLPEKDELLLSEALRLIFGYEPGETATLPDIWERMLPEYRVLLGEQLESARNGNATASMFQMRMQDGSIKHLRSITAGARVQNGRLEMIGSVQDVTEQTLAQDALNQARADLAHVARVATLNAMTASIAHEVSQPLSGILTNASTSLRMLAAEPPNVDGAIETARRTIRDANRAAGVLKRLREMFSKKAPITELVDLNDATRDVIAVAAGELQRRSARLQTELADGLPPVSADRVQLQQVILNLMLNAADAMDGVKDRPRSLLVKTQPETGGGVRMEVRDVGTGFDPGAAEQLFEAFYTTKANGMGIGLSICRTIIESHRGRLWATPNDGPGATFGFSIPVASELAAAGAVSQAT
jgi:PAS domain S-box-containing protein